MNLTKNIGSVDLAIRWTAGAAILLLALLYQSWWGAVGAILLLTALSRFCPLYQLLGLSTEKR